MTTMIILVVVAIVTTLLVIKFTHDYRVKTNVLNTINKNAAYCNGHLEKVQTIMRRHNQNHIKVAQIKVSVDDFDINKKIDVSRSIVTNVKNSSDPDKYIIKYFFDNDYAKANEYFSLLKNHKNVLQSHTELKDDYKNQIKKDSSESTTVYG